MKKRTIIALIAAVGLIFAGGLLVTLGLSTAQNDRPQTERIRQEITVEEPFDSVVIDTDVCDVKFAMLSGRDDCMIRILAQEKIRHSAVVEQGVLKIEMTDERKWTDHISVFGMTEKVEMTLYLPAAEYASLQVRTDTGDITLLGEPSFREMMLRSDTGDITCANLTAQTLDCMTATGDIAVRDSNSEKTKLQSDTGDLDISGCEGEQVHMTTNTGEVDVKHVTAELFTCSSDTGEVELDGVNVADYLQVFTTTGDIGIDNCDAGRVNIATDTGDVEGHFLTPKWFSAFSDTGNVRVPDSREGGDCMIKSNTGDIHFE